MITYSTKIENNQFKVTWDFTPKDIKCSRGNYTAVHKGGGTTSRKGIWEGIELVEAQVKVGNGPWTKFKQNKVTVYTTDNNIEFLAKAKYRLKTMGYHFQCTNGSYPFFYYGNMNGDPNHYSHGYFTDGAPAAPAQLHDIHAIVPKDWSLVKREWSDWAYKHAQETPNWTCDPGRYEQRNGNYEGANNGNGWISDTGWKQAWRKSCYFTFEKVFSKSGIKSSGIIKDATTPELTVKPAKGSSGTITIKHKDANGSAGKFRIYAYCKDKRAIVNDFPQSGWHANGAVKTYNVNFDEMFGESYEGNDVTYEAWAMNSHEKVSKSTGIKGGHRYNGRPSIPNGLFITGKNDIIYNNITFNWNSSKDPDNDSISYDLWLKITKDNVVIKDTCIAQKVNTLYYNYDISANPDGCKYEFKVRAYDGLLYSEWSKILTFEKGSKPKGTITLISPIIDNTYLYTHKPRFAFDGYDGKSIFVVNINNKEYDTKNNPLMFTRNKTKVMFLFDESYSSIKISAYMKNEYGTSDISSTYYFKVKDGEFNINEDDIVKVYSIKQIENAIIEKAKAYNMSLKFDSLIPKESYITSKQYNDYRDVLKAINDSINNIIETSTFDRTLISSNIVTGTINDDILWENLIKDIRNI